MCLHKYMDFPLENYHIFLQIIILNVVVLRKFDDLKDGFIILIFISLIPKLISKSITFNL